VGPRAGGQRSVHSGPLPKLDDLHWARVARPPGGRWNSAGWELLRGRIQADKGTGGKLDRGRPLPSELPRAAIPFPGSRHRAMRSSGWFLQPRKRQGRFQGSTRFRLTAEVAPQALQVAFLSNCRQSGWGSTVRGLKPKGAMDASVQPASSGLGETCKAMAYRQPEHSKNGGVGWHGNLRFDGLHLSLLLRWVGMGATCPCRPRGGLRSARSFST